MHNAMIHNTLFVAKDKAPYADELEQSVYLDPLARVSENKESKLIYTNKSIQSTEFVDETTNKAAKLLESSIGNKGVGVDVELISSINIENETFIERNFTKSEIEYCENSSSPQSSFAGTWSAKEAVFKSLEVESKGAGASLKDIEILRDSKGVPTVSLNGLAKDAATKNGVKNVKVSISHDDVQSLAVAISEF
ncbi:unnamed protein product [[Candida] boidinii]|nr:unnamed protein product [[Candida] boidinii]